ncbi:ArsR/SmtB family transcription factor [Fodinicola feengrottensis]|uniref:Metalloregulator ArsR/SmtB family transcription factor n=1 Tax=Fodinicola feengrottensis TaxID=435914 RepID=A0ABN2FQP6_9ACTN|nr:metalloregulator ArsR/SmtB family transcription factor [Fodinicola feengrottensis]
MSGRAAKTVLFDQFARVGKALGSGSRLELLDLLAQGERTVEALAETAGLGLSTASAHLQTLKRAHLVATRRDGTKIYYRLAGEDVAALYALVRTVAQRRIPDVEPARRDFLGTGIGAGAEPVDREELLARARTGEVTVLDVRPGVEYQAGHIPGALNIPLHELADRLDELPADQEIVAYCRGAYCVLSHDATRLLAGRGYRARVLADGMLEWRLAGHPVTTA